jgi:hypothetical protein
LTAFQTSAAAAAVNDKPSHELELFREAILVFRIDMRSLLQKISFPRTRTLLSRGVFHYETPSLFETRCDSNETLRDEWH